MLAFAVRRFLTAIVSVWLASLVVFSAIVAIPGDPAEIILGLNSSQEARAALRTKLGLDVPAPRRYVAWLGGVLRGDFGESLNYQQPVAKLIGGRLKVSVPLSLGAALVATLLAIPLGILAAVRRGTFVDPLVVALSQLGAAIPGFWLGLIFILYFAVELRLFPAGGFTPFATDPAKWFKSLVLPMLALGLGQAAVMVRMTRAAMLEVLNQDFVRTARAKGLGRRSVVLKHALRNAMVTIITILGLSLTNVFIGSIVIEQVFALPGMGRLAITAIGTRDFPLLQGEILVYAATIVFLGFLVDLSYGLLDPRIRYS
ncbi:MAG: ABC transporter permease [Trueperaceae bacterium]|nr:ABC transporter permease [Trueperaceae bacterium]MCO5172775.1 ABC transporter permease [Trueperaceae bacterium]MCW5820678.1 ABC transporter permease [Trueperaceae bacterium]